MNPSEAEEHLRVIRRLMERATIYRAISSPTALVGGMLSLVVGSALHFSSPDRAMIRHLGLREDVIFYCAWGGVFLLTGLANLWFLAREAKRRGGSLFSPAMWKALSALFPAMLTAGVLTAVLSSTGAYPVMPMVWIICYGLALLSASQISPQAIPRLGWAFLLTGLGCILFSKFSKWEVFSIPHLLMALTFGGLHLLYGVFTWPGKEPAEG